jgi:hypothetical protein
MVDIVDAIFGVLLLFVSFNSIAIIVIGLFLVRVCGRLRLTSEVQKSIIENMR